MGLFTMCKMSFTYICATRIPPHYFTISVISSSFFIIFSSFCTLEQCIFGDTCKSEPRFEFIGGEFSPLSQRRRRTYVPLWFAAIALHAMIFSAFTCSKHKLKRLSLHAHFVRMLCLEWVFMLNNDREFNFKSQRKHGGPTPVRA